MRHTHDLIWVRRLPVLVLRVDMRRSVLNLGHVLLMNHDTWGDSATYRHQLTHIEQLIDHHYLGYVAPWLLSRRFRLRMDADAFRVELACSEQADHIGTKLRLARRLAIRHRISEEKALSILSLTRGCPI